MTSCFFVRNLKNVRSFCGSMSRTTLRAFAASCECAAAYWFVVAWSSVDLMGIPRTTQPVEAGIKAEVQHTSERPDRDARDFLNQVCLRRMQNKTGRGVFAAHRKTSNRETDKGP